MTSFVGKDVFGVILAQNDVIMVTDVIILTYDVSFEFKLPPKHYITMVYYIIIQPRSQRPFSLFFKF